MNGQIWQCTDCKRTYSEYVNGCPAHEPDELPHPVVLVYSDLVSEVT